MNKIKATLLIFGLAIGIQAVFAQSAVVSTGGTATGSGGTVTYTVGQIAVQTNSNGVFSVAEGVQQPYEISVVGVDEYPGISLSMSVYPNPTTDILKLEVSDGDFSGELKVFDMNGKYLLSKKIENNLTEMDFSVFAPGTYFLNVYNSKEQVKSFKVIKMVR